MFLSNERKLESLHAVPLFAGCNPGNLTRIADLTQEAEFAAGDYIVRQGQVGTGFYLIVDGGADVLRGGKVLAHLGPGDSFGELSLLDHEPRVAHVRATEKTTVLALASWDFMKMLESDASVAIGLLRQLAKRLRAVEESHRH
jgi:CRP-like cAMP-binding protein